MNACELSRVLPGVTVSPLVRVTLILPGDTAVLFPRPGHQSILPNLCLWQHNHFLVNNTENSSCLGVCSASLG